MSAAHTTGTIAGLVGAELVGPPDLAVTGVESLERAGPGAITFIRSVSFARSWAGSAASAALVTRGIEVPGHDPAKRALLVVPNADAAMVRLLQLFSTDDDRPPVGVHPTAVVDPAARIDPGARIGPLCVIGPRAVIGPDAALVSSVTVARDARIGRGATLRQGVVIFDRCTIGERCLLHPGVVIGADGFGFYPTPKGPGKIPHIGHVEIGDDVEIGANSCVDRGKFGATIIGAGTKIDNLVQIGHNVTIGRGCLICAGVGIAGSAVLGDGVVLGGQTGVADAARVGSLARVGAQAGVAGVVPPESTYLGCPARPANETARMWAAFPKLPELLRRVRAIEKELERTESPQEPVKP